MNKITPDIECTCRISSQPVLKLVAGNDFTMRISMTKTQGDSTVPYDLSNAEDLVVNAVALDGTTIELDSFIEDSSHIIAAVDAQQFDMYVRYSVEVIWRDEPYDKRACTSDVFMWVATQQEANQAQNEIVSGPYDYELEIINDIAYVMIGTIPSTEGAVTYAQLEQELSYYATISYVQEAISYVEVDMSDYYNKTEIDTTLASYATQAYVTEAISNIPDIDLSDYYTKSEIDTTLSSYVTSSDFDTTLSSYATQTYVTNAISQIPSTDLSNYYTKSEIDTTLGSYVTYTDWDTNNQSVSYDLGYLDDRVTYIEQNGGGGGSVPSDVVTCYDASYIYMLTQSEYDTLEQNQQLDSDTFYYISDTTSNYVTQSDLQNAISGISIPTDISDLTDNQSIIPTDNSQLGNGANYVSSTDITTIVQLSQNDYDDLVNNSSVDPNTMYIIV